MGQRSQIVIFYDVRYGTGNEAQGLQILHNQWLYGMSMYNYGKALVRAFNHILREDSNKSGLQMRDLMGAVGYANYGDLEDFRHTEMPSKECDNASHFANSFPAHLKRIGDFEKAFCEWLNDNTDNNNGYLLVAVRGGQVTYQFLTGTEDAREVKPISAKGYVNQFYTDEKLAENNIHLEKEHDFPGEGDVIAIVKKWWNASPRGDRNGY